MRSPQEPRADRVRDTGRLSRTFQLRNMRAQIGDLPLARVDFLLQSSGILTRLRQCFLRIPKRVPHIMQFARNIMQFARNQRELGKLCLRH